MVIVPRRQRTSGPVYQTTPARLELVYNIIQFPDNRELIQNVISDQRPHLIPLALL